MHSAPRPDVAETPGVLSALGDPLRRAICETLGADLVAGGPPERRAGALQWHPGRSPATAQWVEVAFAAHPSGTRVTLSHRGWGNLGEDAPATRGNDVPGWQLVLVERFGGYCTRPAQR